MIQISTREELLQIQTELGVGADWHEPDNQQVTARHFGVSFDNAGTWGPDDLVHKAYCEQYIVLYKDEEPYASVNLAMLFAWATGFEN